ncbi:MAG: Smr/MutS family protein [Candidatus Delongbacteria bacterium]|nr:Smr/MutS family protein [Candidatus Delongbacteria bacterium]MBN2835452.1 Smr/MutS family protein [Candidatus Delongbacteria bacterium]
MSKIKELDLHGYTLSDAVDKFKSFINSNVGKEVLVIHGYGSSGGDSVIKDKVRKILISENFKYLTGEIIDGNPGYTKIFVNKKLQTDGEIFKLKFLDFISTPKTEAKISARFKLDKQQFNEIIQKMIVNNEIIVQTKGSLKLYLKDGANE